MASPFDLLLNKNSLSTAALEKSLVYLVDFPEVLFKVTKIKPDDW